MLIFMTFSVWLGLAVVAGTAWGFFFFGARSANLVSTNQEAITTTHS
jgi:hypothetical protein